jgi:internalin A
MLDQKSSGETSGTVAFRTAVIEKATRMKSWVLERIRRAKAEGATSLDLSDGDLTDLPAELFELQQLESLNLARNRIAPATISGLASLLNLTSLDISLNHIENAGASALASLKNLNSLDLRLNSIGDTGASALAPLKKLTSLNISLNNIGDAGASVLASLKNLTSLDVADNYIRYAGASALASLPNLTSLDLRHNSIGDAAASALASLATLTSLDVSSNNIGSAGASALASLPNLTSLDLRYNNIGDAGASALASLSNLTSLDLRHSNIGDAGASALASLTNLTLLDVSSNNIGHAGARALASLINLTSLALSENNIGDAGAKALASLPNLTSLDLRHNSIGDAGARALATLTNLTSLTLSENNIGDAEARALASLTNLTSLNVRNTNIGDVGASALASLTNLTSLDVSGNNIGHEGARALETLANLTELYVGNNNIGDTGASALASLTNLTVLDLKNCQLTKLPRTLVTLTRLYVLCLHGNPIDDCPLSILGDSPWDNCLPRVRSHLADLEQGAEADRELKLILLGNGRVGKTSIVRFLMDEPFDPEEKSTHAIQLRVRNEVIDGDEVRINIWDFGGQDIYLNTHSLFLKSRAVFLIAWDAETEASPGYTDEQGLFFENRPLQYWIDYVRTYSRSSPIIVVQNKCEDAGRVQPNAELGDAQITACSAKTGTGGDVLKAQLKEAYREQLAHPAALLIGRGRWRVKQEIRRRQDADDQRPAGEPKQHQLLEYSAFVALCEEEPGSVSSPEQLLRFLHDTGVVYHSPGLFGNQSILDQRWAIEAIYTLFHRQTCYHQMQSKKGRFRPSDLHDLAWHDRFSPEEQRLFLSFMVSCAICFRVSERSRDTEYIAPHFLPSREEVAPRLQDRLETVDPQQSLHYRYRHRFLHEGLMLRFLARIGELFGDAAVYWKDGVQLKVGPPRAVAEVVCRRHIDGNPAHGEIVVQVWGEGRERLLHQLRTEFDRLQAGEREIEQAASLDGETWLTLADLQRPADPTGRPIDPQALRFLLRKPTDDCAEGLDAAQIPKEPAMPAPKPAIYISYAWGVRDDVVNGVYESLKAGGYHVRRDKENIPYRGSIEEFMRELGQGACVVAIVSDKSLRSPNCMFELLEIHRNQQFRKQLFPIVLPDAKIYDLKECLDYPEYWQKEYNDVLKRVRRLLPSLAADGSMKKYEKYKEIAAEFDRIASTLADMNAMTPQQIAANDFEVLKQAIDERLRQIPGDPDRWPSK